MQYGKNADAGCNNGGRCSAIIMPSFSDFVIDVEKNARRALEHAPLALKYFMTRYRDNNQQLDDVPWGYAELDLEVRELVGKRFLAVGIAPLSKYRKAIDTR